MFETVFDLEDTINLLELERILFERKEGHAGRFLDGEEFYVYAQDTLTELAAEAVYLEITESMLYRYGQSNQKQPKGKERYGESHTAPFVFLRDNYWL